MKVLRPVRTEVYSVEFYDVENPTTYEGSETVKEKMSGSGFLRRFLFEDEKMMGELTVILFVSLLLMYFILCAQFESFLQPLIVLLEIPVDTAFALITLWVFWTYAEFDVGYRYYCNLRYCGE